MGLRHDGNDAVTLTETGGPRTRVQRPNQDCVARVVPSSASIEALCHLVRVGTSDAPGPVSALEISGAQGRSDNCRPAEARQAEVRLIVALRPLWTLSGPYEVHALGA
jgi:hypothetical protein